MRRSVVTLLVAAMVASVAGVALLSSAVAQRVDRPLLGKGLPMSGCVDPASRYPAHRDRANPLDLPTPPGANPLRGAKFFVPGPAKGSAASTIAEMVGDGRGLEDLSETWGQFSHELHHGPLAQRLASNPRLAHRVAELSKVAAEPEAQRISSSSSGGGPGAIYAQTTKILCQNLAADPGSIPIFDTYFLHPDLGGCPSSG